jgi:NAD(P)-dependent dehydrogenase (short-subunit alcohol dehydrogenase family)
MEHHNQLNGKTYIITGANAGIGKAASVKLARLGVTVVMACRNEERGHAAMEEVKMESGGNGDVHLLLVDMSSLKSIRNFVDEFTEQFERLDGLINNAAHFDLSQKEPVFTPEGAESVFATNHLGPFLLTNLLLDALKISSPSRVVNISSMGLISYPFLKIQFDDLTTSRERKFSVQFAYYHSKLAQCMFTRELARRLEGSGVTANAIRVPNVRIDIDRYPDLSPLMLKMYSIKQRFAITPMQMAEAYVRVVAGPAFEGVSGEYFSDKCKRVKMPRYAYDEAACRRLWEVSEEMVGLNV